MRTIKKITPSRPSSFDQQFWPVIVALTVLCSIGIGAIVTLLRGPWLWGSLLILPVVATLAILGLFYLDDSKLRRSLQLAIILSLAVHLMILIFSSVVIIFQNPFEVPKRTIVQHSQRSIQITDRRASFVWEETNHRETPEPAVEEVQKQTTATDVKPQPIPVPETKPETKPQLIRRETPAHTIPRQGKSLSQLRRQIQNQQPKSSQPVEAITSASKSHSAANRSANESNHPESKKAESVQRQNEPISTAASREVATAPTKQATIELADSTPRRAPIANQRVESAPQSSPSNARKTATTPRLPIANKKQEIPNRPRLSIKKQAEPQPAPQAANITRRPMASETSAPSITTAEKSTTSPQPQIARSAERRTSPQTKPSIATENSKLSQPRRSTSAAQLTASPIAIEKPARQPDSTSASVELNSKTLSISHSTAGMAGAGRSENLETATGGMTSPATRPSDSASRREAENAPTEIRQLATSQQSNARRAAGTAKLPTSAFLADTTSMAKISGSRTPTDHSVESSAARIDSATADNRGSVSVEKGTTSVDLGPTKIVADTTDSPRRSGGGQPEISQMNPDATRRSRSSDDQQPTLVADAGVEAMAPSSQTSAPAASELEANAESMSLARSGGEAETALKRDSAIEAGQFANAGQSSLATSLADVGQRADRDDASTTEFSDEDEEDEEATVANQRSRLALAPITRSDPGMGNFETELGRSAVHSDVPVDEPSESFAATLQRTASSAVPGSGIGRTATSLLLQAASSLPVIESTAPRRATNTAALGETDNLFDTSVPHESVDNRLSGRATVVQPNLSDPVKNDFSTSETNLAQGDVYEIEASESELQRNLSTLQELGAAMEVIAIEGPAGLADRSDDSLGVMERPASRDSEQIQPDLDQRFRNSNFGGVPAINPAAVLAKQAFRQRNPAARANAYEPTTEAAIQLGLEFLARHQRSDGSWSLTRFDVDHPQHGVQLNSDTAATGLAILAFQGAGYNHREFRYARVVNHGVQWLIEHQQDDGNLYVSSDAKSDSACRLYSHGIAALALTEAYGMTQDHQIKTAAQQAIDYIVASQDPRHGGWRYFDDPKKRSSDTSVTGWMMMALQSGRLAGLEVDANVFRGIDQWLNVAADPIKRSQYRYNPYAVDSEGVSRIQGRQPTAPMTSVGLLMRIYSGFDRNDPLIVDGATWLVTEHLPSDATPEKRDTYYWYYATQVLKHVDGPLWEKWDGRLRPLLIRSQEKTGDLSGSWHPYNPIPDRWGAFGGRLYVTTMNLLSLEVRHRMLPLYKKTNDQ